MKKLQGLIIFCLLVVTSSAGFGQGFVDNALLFSRTKPTGSARILGLGGAQVALGGDYSSALSNPAGLGMYNRSEATLSLGLNNTTTTSNYLDIETKGTTSTFNLPGASVVFNYPNQGSNFLGGSFAITVNRSNDFNSLLKYRGDNSYTSIIDYYIEDATGFATFDTLNFPVLNFDFPTGLAYDNYLIQDSAYIKTPNFNSGDLVEYFSVVGTYPNNPNDRRSVSRNENSRVKGSQYQFTFAYGANLSDKLFLGASVGFTTLRYEFLRQYREDNFNFELDPSYNPLLDLNLEENISIRGSGINLTLGMIYRPIDAVQVGASLTTPTYYELEDTYTASIETNWASDFIYPREQTPLNNIYAESQTPAIDSYNFRTPLKVNAGAAFFIGKSAFLTGDIEWVNYQNSTYGEGFEIENEDIDYFFTSVINYRVGAEYRIDPFRLRVGYGVQSDPYNDEFDVDQQIKTYSAGIGFRRQPFFIDLAINSSVMNDRTYSPYTFLDGSGPIVDLKSTNTSGVLTVGFTF